MLSTVELMVLNGRLVDRDPGFFLTVWDGGQPSVRRSRPCAPRLCSGLAEVASALSSPRSPPPDQPWVCARATRNCVEVRSGVPQVAGSVAAVNTRARLYRLHSLQPPPSVTGQARPAEPGDDTMLVDWLHRFRVEALGVVGDPDVRRGRTARESPDKFFFWMVNLHHYSLAGVRLPIAGISRLGVGHAN